MEVSLDRVSQFAGMIFLQGMDQLGFKENYSGEQWFQRNGWDCVVKRINDVLDGTYKASDIANMIREEYILRAQVFPIPEMVENELIVWEAVARGLAAVVEHGELVPENNPVVWGQWVEEKLFKMKEAAGEQPEGSDRVQDAPGEAGPDGDVL